MLTLCVLFVLFSASLSFRPDDNIEGHELLDRCLEGQNHKRRPGPEDELHHQCTPWTNRSCCTDDTTQLIHYGQLYNFNWDHCSHVKHLSEACKSHFIQDHCFFECSPNVGPWLVPVNDMKTRNESFKNVPLCATDCDNWFKDCENDYTCTENWMKNFTWTKVGRDKKKTNVCPVGSTCKTFKETFKTSENFCESVWDNAWKYTSDEQPCMRIWFDGTQGNPNDEVARWKVKIMTDKRDDSTSHATYMSSPIWSVLLPIAFSSIGGLLKQ